MRNRQRAFLFGFLLLICLACGCSGSEPQANDATAAVAPPPAAPADPRYASPEALVQHAKSIVDAPEPNMHDFFALFQWETPEQKTWMSYVHDIAVPHGDLRREFLKRFPSEKWMLQVPIWFYDVRIPNTNVTNNDGQRAEAKFSEGKGSTLTLHMVKKYDRWWISGYSLERAGRMPALQKLAADTGQSLDTLLSAASREQPAVIDLAAQLKIGNIKTTQQFWEVAEREFGSP